MAFDPLVTNPGRLEILTALANEPSQPFVELRRRTGLTDGNLATHARRLQSAGFVAIEKSISDGKPLTTLKLTREGREALDAHAQALMFALERRPMSAATEIDAPSDRMDDSPNDAMDSTPVATEIEPASAQDDWVD